MGVRFADALVVLIGALALVLRPESVTNGTLVVVAVIGLLYFAARVLAAGRPFRRRR